MLCRSCEFVKRRIESIFKTGIQLFIKVIIDTGIRQSLLWNNHVGGRNKTNRIPHSKQQQAESPLGTRGQLKSFEIGLISFALNPQYIS